MTLIIYVGGGGHHGRDGDGTGWGGDRESGKRLWTLRTKFMLRHQLSGCYLFSHKVSIRVFCRLMLTDGIVGQATGVGI
jgi:hypothetical protein